MKIKLSIDHCKSYATEANLDKGLERLGLSKYRHIACRKPDGRWTAIFSFAWAQQNMDQHYTGFAACHGFMTFG